ncbi:predicted protein [Nematostella vectensis]|uniref:Uncharacterized protein n=1 Tax=Nematostella vectensis TaxID=45351 RepID=A7SP99_NEMVE|nr:predicted protein [Nematostella vectensis]|eukprot:XP_001626566.1 predicted protein [Nematostella vectensis]
MLNLQNVWRPAFFNCLLRSSIPRRYHCTAPSSRSWLFVSDPSLCNKASRSPADVVVLDMEDGVSEHLKSFTRHSFADVLQSNSLNHSRVFVRLNALEDEQEFSEDINTLCLPQVRGFILPKLKNLSCLKEFTKVIAFAENRRNLSKGHFKIIPVIETTSAFSKLEHIARGSRRIEGLITGMADFMADSLCDMYSPTYMTYLSHVVITCRAANILPIAGAIEKLDDFVAMEIFYRKMKACGFVGSAALSPPQATLANIVFSFTQQETHWAKQVLQASTMQESRTFIGPPHRKRASVITSMLSKSHKGNPSRDKSFQKGRITSRGLRDRVVIGHSEESMHHVTLTEAWIALWNASFLNFDHVSNSVEYARQLGMRTIPAPFALVNTIALSLAVNHYSYSAIVHLGCYDNVLHTPLYPGDTVRARYQITDAVQYEKRMKKFTIVESVHQLVNQHDKTVFTARKRTMFPPLPISHNEKKASVASWDTSYELRHQILNQPVTTLGPVLKQPELLKGDLLLHEDYKIFSSSEMRELARLLKITNPHHHNKLRHPSSEILVPGPFVVAASLSNTGYDIGNVLYEELPVHTNINKVNPGDQIGTLTYVSSTHALADRPDLEEITLVHVGVKNTDLAMLEDNGIPTEIMSSDVIKPAQYEQMCADRCPMLYRKIACKAANDMYFCDLEVIKGS